MKQYDLINVSDCTEWLLNNNFSYKRSITDWQQFNHCQAWYRGVVLGNESGEFEVYFLQSYRTMVAAYIVESGELVRFGKYSRTTSKQTTQWGNYMNRQKSYRELRCRLGI